MVGPPFYISSSLFLTFSFIYLLALAHTFTLSHSLVMQHTRMAQSRRTQNLGVNDTNLINHRLLGNLPVTAQHG